MRAPNWPTAFIIVGVLLSLTALLLFGKSTSANALVVPALAILGALGYVVKQQAENKEIATTVKEQTNGNNKQLIEMLERKDERFNTFASEVTQHIREMGDKMASMSPPEQDRAGHV